MISTDKKNKIIITYIYLLMPFIIYGIYKNGFLLYEEGLISFINIFKPLFLVLISIFITLLVDFIFIKKIKLSFNLLNMILLAMIVSPQISYLVFIILVFIFNIIYRLFKDKIKINYVCLFFLLTYFVNLTMNLDFLNYGENLYNYNLSIVDIILGRNIGGISSTSIVLSLISFVILAQSIYYKKYLPIIINIIYICLCLIYFFITDDTSLLINSSVIFASIFISTLPMYSAYSLKGTIFSGTIIAFLTFIISLFNSYISIYLAILIVSFFTKKLDNLKLINK